MGGSDTIADRAVFLAHVEVAELGEFTQLVTGQTGPCVPCSLQRAGVPVRNSAATPDRGILKKAPVEGGIKRDDWQIFDELKEPIHCGLQLHALPIHHLLRDTCQRDDVARNLRSWFEPSAESSRYDQEDEVSLTSFIRQAISCYLADPEAAWIHLDNTDEQICSDKASPTREENDQAALLSQAVTAKALRDRFLEKQLAPQERSLSPASNESPNHAIYTPDWSTIEEEQRRIRFQNILRVLTWLINQDRDAWIALFPSTEASVSEARVMQELSEDEIQEYESCSDWPQLERKFEFAFRSAPNYEAYLLRKYLDWIDVSVAKLQRDKPLSCAEFLPEHLRDYLFVASWCNAYGLDPACAVICGAISEQAIRAKYEARRNELAKSSIRIEGIGPRATFGTIIELASRAEKDLPVVSETAARMAREIDRLRSQAAHGDPHFFHRPEDVRKSVLAITCELLETLFSPES